MKSVKQVIGGMAALALPIASPFILQYISPETSHPFLLLLLVIPGLWTALFFLLKPCNLYLAPVGFLLTTLLSFGGGTGCVGPLLYLVVFFCIFICYAGPWALFTWVLARRLSSEKNVKE